MLNGNIVYKVKGKSVLRATPKEMKKYFIRIDEAPVKDNTLFVSIGYKKDVMIYFWCGDYSVGITYNEFMSIHNKIKDKDGVISEFVEDRI